MPKKEPEVIEQSLEEIEQQVAESIEEEVERTTLGFQKNQAGLFIRGGTLKAHLKDCANQIKDVVKVKAFRAKVANCVYIEEYHVNLFRGEQILQEADGEFEQPVHVFTPQGPRNALKIIKYVNNPTIRFTLLCLPHKEATIEKVKEIFVYGSIHGYGGERGMGEGRYTYSIMD